jgi:hypothetical protein
VEFSFSSSSSFLSPGGSLATAEALPPGGPASPVRFDWSLDNNNFGVAAVDAGGFSVRVASVDHSKVSSNGDDEDDI